MACHCHFVSSKKQIVTHFYKKRTWFSEIGKKKSFSFFAFRKDDDDYVMMQMEIL